MILNVVSWPFLRFHLFIMSPRVCPKEFENNKGSRNQRYHQACKGYDLRWIKGCKISQYDFPFWERSPYTYVTVGHQPKKLTDTLGRTWEGGNTKTLGHWEPTHVAADLLQTLPYFWMRRCIYLLLSGEFLQRKKAKHCPSGNSHVLLQIALEPNFTFCRTFPHEGQITRQPIL